MNTIMHPQTAKPLEFRIDQRDWEIMRADAMHKAPEEACGLVAGKMERTYYQAIAVIPLTNMLHSSLRYRVPPQEQLEAFLQIEKQGWELVGIYHSHPDGPEMPSATDIAEAYYPDAAYLIWSRTSGEWACRVFIIQNGLASEIPLVVNRETQEN